MAKTPVESDHKDNQAAAKPKTGLLGALRSLTGKLKAKRPPVADKVLKPIPRPASAEKPVDVVGIPSIDNGWVADRPTVLEAMWGAGWHLPLGEVMMTVLVRAFGLTKEMSVLDLSAGVGGAARHIAGDFKTYVTGLEMDAELAAHGAAESKKHGMARTATIKAYDPEMFNADRHYDCIVARELFYRIKDKPRFIKAVAASMKNYGQICWTDFLVEKKDLQKPAIVAWLRREGEGVTPMALGEVTAIWKGLHFDVRIAEDRTEKYTHGVLEGLANFMEFLKTHKAAAPTKLHIAREIELWALRLAAMKQGMKLYRFYALRK